MIEFEKSDRKSVIYYQLKKKSQVWGEGDEEKCADQENGSFVCKFRGRCKWVRTREIWVDISFLIY